MLANAARQGAQSPSTRAQEASLAMSERVVRLARLVRVRRAGRLRRFGAGLSPASGLSAPGAGRSSAEMRRPESLSNTGSRRALVCPRFDAITRPVSLRPYQNAGPRGHAKRADLRGR